RSSTPWPRGSRSRCSRTASAPSTSIPATARERWPRWAQPAQSWARRQRWPVSENGPAEIGGTLAERLGAGRPPDAEMLNMACFWVTRSLAELEFSTPAAEPLARCLLRVAGRILIDSASEGADPATWANTEEMAL